jgi:hypothetical protein
LGTFHTWVVYHNAFSQGIDMGEMLRMSRAAQDRQVAVPSVLPTSIQNQTSSTVEMTTTANAAEKSRLLPVEALQGYGSYSGVGVEGVGVEGVGVEGAAAVIVKPTPVVSNSISQKQKSQPFGGSAFTRVISPVSILFVAED